MYGVETWTVLKRDWDVLKPSRYGAGVFLRISWTAKRTNVLILNELENPIGLGSYPSILWSLNSMGRWTREYDSWETFARDVTIEIDQVKALTDDSLSPLYTIRNTVINEC